MEITFSEVNEIFKTLPIGYYLKRDVERTLSLTDSATYYIPTEDKIVVSFEMIKNVFSSLEKETISEEEKESLIRGFLYHEVSHAFLTPDYAAKYYPCRSKVERDSFNIFEDERIESLLRDFYMNVNFRNLIHVVNGESKKYPSPEVSVMNAFFYLVRYRECPEERFLNRVHKLIVDFKDINKNTDYGKCSYYFDKILSLYCDFRDWYLEELEKSKEDKESGDNEDNKDEESESSESSKSTSMNNKEHGENESSKAGKGTKGESEESTEETKENSVSESNEESEVNDTVKKHYDEESALNTDASGKNLLEKASKYYINENMTNEINNILNSINKVTKRTSGCINSYSGIFDPRSVIREDYKYFVQKNRNGHIKMCSKIKLNLFIDRSGSFRNNQDFVNQLLHSLMNLEKLNPDFSFDLVTMGIGERLESKKNLFFKAYGGNDFGRDIHGLYKEVQSKDAINYNIVLFDGDAFSDSYSKTEAQKNLKVFNNSNTTIISDPDNQSSITRHCTRSKNIITYNYTNELYKNVMETLRGFARI